MAVPDTAVVTAADAVTANVDTNADVAAVNASMDVRASGVGATMRVSTSVRVPGCMRVPGRMMAAVSATVATAMRLGLRGRIRHHHRQDRRAKRGRAIGAAERADRKDCRQQLVRSHNLPFLSLRSPNLCTRILTAEIPDSARELSLAHDG